MASNVSFFQGATDVQIYGGEFNVVNGDYTEINGSRHTSNINSFNTTNNTAINSFNTNSEYYYRGQQGRHQITPSSQRSGIGGHITADGQHASNSSDSASQTDSNGNRLDANIHPMSRRMQHDLENLFKRSFPSANLDDDSGSDVSDSEGHEPPAQLPTTNVMDVQQGPAQLSNPQSSYVPNRVDSVPPAQQSATSGVVMGQAPPFYHAASSQSTHGNQDIYNIFGGPAVFAQGTSGATFTTVNGPLTRYDYRQNTTNINSGNVENNYYEDSYNTTTTEIHTTNRQRKLGKHIRRGA